MIAEPDRFRRRRRPDKLPPDRPRFAPAVVGPDGAKRVPAQPTLAAWHALAAPWIVPPPEPFVLPPGDDPDLIADVRRYVREGRALRRRRPEWYATPSGRA